jgi:hypothetical protein
MRGILGKSANFCGPFQMSVTPRRSYGAAVHVKR